MLGRIRLLIGIVIVGLFLSGLTALPLQRETESLVRWTTILSFPHFVTDWISRVNIGLRETCRAYPFIGYGTDWLAFGHFVIAIFFIGAWIDPVRNIWLLRAGQIACLLVIPTALICGGFRGIPFGGGPLIPLLASLDSSRCGWPSA